LSSLKELSYLAGSIEFGGLLDALEVQVENNGENLTEEQIKNWLKIAHLGKLFIEQCEDNFLEIARQNVLLKRNAKKRAALEKKIYDLRQENNKLKRINSELLETVDKGLRV